MDMGWLCISLVSPFISIIILFYNSWVWYTFMNMAYTSWACLKFSPEYFVLLLLLLQWNFPNFYFWIICSSCIKTLISVLICILHHYWTCLFYQFLWWIDRISNTCGHECTLKNPLPLPFQLVSLSFLFLFLSFLDKPLNGPPLRHRAGQCCLVPDIKE